MTILLRFLFHFSLNLVHNKLIDFVASCHSCHMKDGHRFLNIRRHPVLSRGQTFWPQKADKTVLYLFAGFMKRKFALVLRSVNFQIQNHVLTRTSAGECFRAAFYEILHWHGWGAKNKEEQNSST